MRRRKINLICYGVRFAFNKGTYERVREDKACSRVWFMSNVISDGAVVPCCYDFRGELKVGNINDKPFSLIWNSSEYRELRKKV